LIAMANDFPSFNPPDDQAFLSRLIVLPFRSVFYSDDDARDRYIKMGVEEERLKPARDKSEILKETIGERPAILARLIAEYILLRDRHNANPAESEECLAAKERYRTANDYIETFFDDSLQRMDGMRISYTRVRELFGEYMGDSRVKMSTRRLIDEITRRYRFIEKRKSNGERVLVNVSEKFDYDKQPGNGEEDPF
jgi:phage/plasmid-associated DNA primase